MSDRLHLPEKFLVHPAGDGEWRIQSSQVSVGLQRVRSPEVFLALVEALRGGIEPAVWLQSRPPREQRFLKAVLDILQSRGLLAPGPPSQAGPTDEIAEHLALYADPTASVNPLPKARLILVGSGRPLAAAAAAMAPFGLGSIHLATTGSVDASLLHAEPWLPMQSRGEALATAVCAALGNRYPQTAFSGEVLDPASDALAPLLHHATLVLHVPATHDPPGRRRLNDAALAAKVPLVARRQVGLEIAVGPVVQASGGPCLRCLDHRLQSNLTRPAEGAAVEAAMGERPSETGPLGLGIGPTVRGLDLLCSDALALLFNARPPDLLAQVAIGYEGRTDTRRHPVLRIPRCPGCGARHRKRPLLDAWGST